MRTGIWRSWNLLEPKQRVTLASLTSLRVVLNFLDILGIAAVGAISAIALGSSEFDSVLNLIPMGRQETIFAILLTTAAVFLGKTVLSSLLALTTYRVLADIEAAFSERVALAIFGGGLGRVKSYSRSEIDYAVTQSSSVAVTQILGQASVLFAEASLAIFIFVLFAVTDLPTALVVTLYFFSVLLLFQLLANRRLRQAGNAQTDSAMSSTQLVLDIVTAYRELFVVARLGRYLEALKAARMASAYSNATHNVLAVIPRQIVELALIVGALIFVGLQLLASGSEGSGFQVGVYLMGSLRMMSALLPLQRAFASLRYIKSQAEVSQNVLEGARARSGRRSADSQSQIGPDKAPGFPFHVIASNLCFNYVSAEGSVTSAVHDVNLEVSPGEFVALIGPSGSGKSTLVDLLLGIYSPSVGYVQVDGFSPSEIIATRPGSIGYVPQKAGLVTGTLRDNVGLGVESSEINPVRVAEVLDAVGLGDLIEQLPNGIDTDLGKQVDALSGGQLQRVGLARALYHEPSLLILDEATSSLDAESEKHISAHLESLKGNTTIITIAHRLSTIQHADRVLLMTNGTIEASGSFEFLMSSSDLVRRYARLLNIVPEPDEF